MRRAVLVASSRFKDAAAFPTLKFPVTDAESLREVLLDPNLCFFDEAPLIADGSVAEALRALERAARASEREDLLLFYYNGHGHLDRDGTLALAMPDSEPNFLSTTSLISEELKRLFHISRAKQKVMILDCCYSGTVGESGFKGSLTDTLRSLAQQIEGTFLLTASAGSKPAFESTAAGGGALTSCFVEGIRTGAAAAPDDDGITLGQLASYVRRKVPGLEAQQPQQWDLGGLGDLPLARKPRVLDDAWEQRAKRKLAAWLRTARIDEELADDVRRAIRQRRDPRYVSQVRLIERWIDHPMTASFFVRDWDRIGGVSPAAPSERKAPVDPPLSPGEPVETASPDSPPPEKGAADSDLHQETSVDGGSDGPRQKLQVEYTVSPPSEDGGSPWPKRMLIAALALGLLIALVVANAVTRRWLDEGAAQNVVQNYADDTLMGNDITSVDAMNGTDANPGTATDSLDDLGNAALDASNTVANAID